MSSAEVFNITTSRYRNKEEENKISGGSSYLQQYTEKMLLFYLFDP